jgi:uncharacterized protein YukE
VGKDKSDAESIQDTIDKTKAEIERQSSEWIGDAQGMVE